MDEVDHALERQQDAEAVWPPAPDADLRSGSSGEVPPDEADPDADERQMCSHRCRLGRFGVQDAMISFSGPESVVVLLRTAMRSFETPYHFRWSGLERLLAHVRAEWQGRPRHHDPIFDRDGWRCSVPACSSRKNLHDHHVLFRSRGGANDLGNRTTVCAWHHLRGIHEGRIRAFGRAPREIVWEVGRQASGAPLFRTFGDRYLAAPG